MHYSAIRWYRDAYNSGKYHPVDHLSETNLAGGRQKLRTGLPFLNPSSESKDLGMHIGDSDGQGVCKVTNTMDERDTLYGGCYLSCQ